MKIRKANANDIEEITKNNILLAIESEKKELEYKIVYQGVKKLIEDDKKGFYLVSEENNDIIGQIMITFEWSDWNNKTMWWIQSVYVDKSYRKIGVFKNLLNKIIKMAKDKNIKKLKLYVHKKNSKAKNVYKKFGMNKTLYDIYKIEL